jgi:ABC-2 type transport system permease protein
VTDTPGLIGDGEVASGGEVAAAIGPHRTVIRRDQWRQVVDITRTLAAATLKGRYFGSVLGYLWSLLRPLMLFGVLYFVFTEILNFGDTIHDYPLKLLLGLVLFGFFGEVTGVAMTSFVSQGQAIRSIFFPRATIPLALACAGAFQLLLNLLVVLVFVLASGISPTGAWLELIPLLALLFAFTFSVALPLSLLYVRYRDMEPIWAVIGQLLFWGTPIVYVIETAPHGLGHAMMLNPLAAIITQLRHAVIDPSAPSAAAAAGSAWLLLVPLAIVLAMAVFAFVLYRRSAPLIAERL